VSEGVYTPPGGGIYIKGESEIKMLVTAGGSQMFQITQGTDVIMLTIDKENDQIIRQGGGAIQYIPGSGNGMIYADDNITSLSGTIADNIISGNPLAVVHRSAFTIATDVNGSKSITVTGPLTHKTPQNLDLSPYDPSNMYSGTMGLIGFNVYVGAKAPKAMEIDAVIMAGNEYMAGSFMVENYAGKKPTGTLKVFGGIIQKNRGAVGTLRNGKLNTGYQKDYYYDGRMANNPPPFFPTTGGYDRLSWRRLVDHLDPLGGAQ